MHVFFLSYSLTLSYFFFFFFNDTATTEIYTLSLHDALPICAGPCPPGSRDRRRADDVRRPDLRRAPARRPVGDPLRGPRRWRGRDRREGRRLGGARSHVERDENADRSHRGRVSDHGRGAGAPPRLGGA